MQELKNESSFELTEEQLLALIATGEKVVVKVWMNDCPNCDTYAPIFEKVSRETLGFKFASFNLPVNTQGKSEFKKKYMTPDQNGKIGAPATMIFENGELAFKNYGLINESQLRELLMPIEAKLFNLYARKGEILTAYEELPEINKRIKDLESARRK
jgi:thiol-disulfide isomerase/thioredoxin